MKDAEELALLLSELNRLPFLVVGRINGPAYGGGLGLIACCDIAIGVESATFSLSEVTLGLIPATISPYVVKRLGESNTRRVMLNAKRFSAKEAVQLGLLHQAVPDEDLDAVVEKEVNGVLRCAPEAVSASKKLISAVDGRPAETVLNETIERLAQTWETESCRKPLTRSYTDKRHRLCGSRMMQVFHFFRRLFGNRERLGTFCLRRIAVNFRVVKMPLSFSRCSRITAYRPRPSRPRRGVSSKTGLA